ncbi:MAG: NifB/NifX family molybdenum-iron cluster-binding protein, partial [Humidesulfovibrio sp.]|nr:NifB/NifX family molybdenum-iron cluster-binding protein [Humidesulfovibrio sp.]
MLVCVACYGDRVAALLETACQLRFYSQDRCVPARCDPARCDAARPGAGSPGVIQHSPVTLPAAVQELGLAGLIELLEGSGAAVLLCGGLTCCALEVLRNSGVHVVPWVGGAPDEVARSWWSDSIQTMKMPGCVGCGKGQRWRRRSGGKQLKVRQVMNEGIIAVTSEGPKLTDMVDPRFGRAAGFVVVDLATMAVSYVDNGSSQVLAQGAGIQAAENVAKAGAGVVLSGFVGPKAFQALSAGGIQVIQNV